MWPFKKEPERVNTTKDLLAALEYLQDSYDVPLIVRQDWKAIVGPADLGTIAAVLSSIFSILEVQAARRVL